jgi:DNA-binding LacI/PurR family transcriptional regulator
MKEETPPMWTDKLPLAEIARIFDRDPAQVRRAYDEWLERKRGRRGPVKPDNRLLSLLSGLSSASISNYVQGKAGSLSEENHRRLGQLVKLVGYVPSRAAQNLRSRRRNTVGVVLPLTSVSPLFYLEVLAGIKTKAAFFGFRRLIYDVPTPDERDAFFSDMPFLDAVDGLIVVSLHVAESELRILERSQLPIVAVHNRLSRPPVIANLLDDDEGELQRLIDQHLIKAHGYRRLALVTLDTRNPLKMGDAERGDWNRIARKNAYHQALRLNGLPPDEHVFTVQEHSYEAGRRVFGQIQQKNAQLEPDERIQAVVCLSDTLAVAIRTCAARARVHLPVTGYDNLAQAGLHEITTIDQKARQVGESAFQHLHNALVYRAREGVLPEPVEEAIGMKAVIRTSCGCRHTDGG